MPKSICSLRHAAVTHYSQGAYGIVSSSFSECDRTQKHLTPLSSLYCVMTPNDFERNTMRVRHLKCLSDSHVLQHPEDQLQLEIKYRFHSYVLMGMSGSTYLSVFCDKNNFSVECIFVLGIQKTQNDDEMFNNLREIR